MPPSARHTPPGPPVGDGGTTAPASQTRAEPLFPKSSGQHSDATAPCATAAGEAPAPKDHHRAGLVSSAAANASTSLASFPFSTPLPAQPHPLQKAAKAAPKPLMPLDTIMARRMNISPEIYRKLTPEQLETWQCARVRETLAQARVYSPHYALMLASSPPGAIRHYADMALLPRMSAWDLREYGLSMLCVSQDEIARVVTLHTSGTSGKPKRLFFSQSDLDATTEFFTEGMRSVAQPGERVLALLPDDRPSSVGRLLAQSISRMGARPLTGNVTMGGEALAHMAYTNGVRAIVGSPMHLRLFALGWQALKLPPGHIHTALLCWDAIPRAVTRLLHSVLGCRTLAHWGMTETGLGGALSCTENSGMHLREADLLVEITDVRTGRPLPVGEWGEITITTLCRCAMPLIRYRTGDAGRLLPGSCPCGSRMRRLDFSPGRFADVIQLPSGAHLRPLDIEEALLPIHELADYHASWHEARQHAILNQEKTPPQANPTLRVTLLFPPTAVATEASLLRQKAQQRLVGIPQLGPLLARGTVRLELATDVLDPKAHDFSKRRIVQDSPGSQPAARTDAQTTDTTDTAALRIWTATKQRDQQ